MDFMNKVRSFLGLPLRRNEENKAWGDGFGNNSTKDHSIASELPIERHPESRNGTGFDVFSNPLEMHRYFEQQLNDVLRQFGAFGGDEPFFGGGEFRDKVEPGFGGLGLFFGDQFQNVPFAEGHFGVEEHAPNRTLRDQYLKPGYHSATPHHGQKSDSDVDGKIDVGDLGTVFSGKHLQQQLQPRIFSQSVITRIVQKPDGTIESHRTVKDQQGNQETTISRKLGDKEYSVITRTDKEGRQETIENLVNMDEQDKHKFIDAGPSEPDKTPPPNWFPYNKFF